MALSRSESVEGMLCLEVCRNGVGRCSRDKVGDTMFERGREGRSTLTESSGELSHFALPFSLRSLPPFPLLEVLDAGEWTTSRARALTKIGLRGDSQAQLSRFSLSA